MRPDLHLRRGSVSTGKRCPDCGVRPVNQSSSGRCQTCWPTWVLRQGDEELSAYMLKIGVLPSPSGISNFRECARFRLKEQGSTRPPLRVYHQVK